MQKYAEESVFYTLITSDSLDEELPDNLKLLPKLENFNILEHGFMVHGIKYDIDWKIVDGNKFVIDSISSNDDNATPLICIINLIEYMIKIYEFDIHVAVGIIEDSYWDTDQYKASLNFYANGTANGYDQFTPNKYTKFYKFDVESEFRHLGLLK